MRAVMGEVLGGVNNLSDAFRAQQAGNVKILVCSTSPAMRSSPDVPTMQEQGYDIDNASVNFRGVMVPKGTPQPIIDKHCNSSDDVRKRRVQSRMAAGGSYAHHNVMRCLRCGPPDKRPWRVVAGL